jgi:hypothetical protein
MKTNRRNRLDLNTPAELAIFNAMQEVEKAGADIRLTEASVLLAKAKDCVANFVDAIDSEPSPVESSADDTIKRISVDFFRYWWNTSGTNTDEGFDKWYALHKHEYASQRVNKPVESSDADTCNCSGRLEFTMENKIIWCNKCRKRFIP